MTKHELTPEQIQRVKRMREDGMTWRSIGMYFHCRAESIRTQIDPEYRLYRHGRIVEARRIRKARRTDEISQGIIERDKFAAIPREPVYDPKRDGPPEWKSVDAYIFGDPPIGRSALDKRFGREKR